MRKLFIAISVFLIAAGLVSGAGSTPITGGRGLLCTKAG
jgi:hypothetical protein